MYNLNVNLATGPGNHNLFSLDTNCTTPKTPEILNSLIAMGNPFDGYNGHNRHHGSGPRIAACPPGNSDTSSSGSPGSPGTPPSVQHTCSQLIKEGLKLTIQTKRRHNGQDNGENDHQRPMKMARRGEASSLEDPNDDDDDDYDDLFSPGVGLTAEDEERRRRRRERNKVAATKCRLKKRERTVNLVQESEILENQNHDLKGQIQELETQRRRLMDMLSMHRPTCIKSTSQSVQMMSYPNHEVDTTNYCGDTPDSSFITSDIPTTSYSHYNIEGCNYSGGYTSAADSGCLA